jgi:hypothetical protein
MKEMEGRSIEEWILNEDKRVFWALPEVVKEAIIERADGKPAGNLHWWNNDEAIGKVGWKSTQTNPSVSSGSVFRIKERK